MKYKPLLISVIISLMIASCQKQTHTEGDSRQQPFVKEAIRFLQTQLSEQAFAGLNTTSPNLVQYQGNPVAVRIYPATDPSPNRFIAMYKKAGRFTGHWVDLSAISKAQTDQYEGTLSLLDLKDQLMKRYTIQENKVTEIYDALEGSNIILNTPSLSNPDNPQELDAVIVSPGRSYNNHNYYGLYWLFNQDDAYEKEYIFVDESRQNGGGESNTEVEVAIAFPGPDHPIKDIKEELKCFTNDPKAVYSVTVNVNQPEPNTNSLVNFGNTHNAGHTYITLQEQLLNGNMIVRNVGFYPLHSAKPGNENDVSVFGEDSQTSYCVSLKVTLSSNEFQILQTELINDQNSRYDLENYNCTTVAITALNSVNVNLPSTIRETFKFEGYNPADLGQDIRKLDLDKFSKENGNRQSIRTVSKKNDLLPPNKTGICK